MVQINVVLGERGIHGVFDIRSSTDCNGGRATQLGGSGAEYGVALLHQTKRIV